MKVSRVEFYPVCVECGRTHCCNIPSEVHDGTFKSVMYRATDDVTSQKEGSCKDRNKPWPAVIGTRFVMEK